MVFQREKREYVDVNYVDNHMLDRGKSRQKNWYKAVLIVSSLNSAQIVPFNTCKVFLNACYYFGIVAITGSFLVISD